MFCSERLRKVDVFFLTVKWVTDHLLIEGRVWYQGVGELRKGWKRFEIS